MRHFCNFAKLVFSLVSEKMHKNNTTNEIGFLQFHFVFHNVVLCFALTQLIEETLSFFDVKSIHVQLSCSRQQ